MNALSGARQGATRGLRGLVARAMASDLYVFVVPGLDVARARGLDLAGAGLYRADTPRHANVLLIAGPLPPALLKAACVVWAQMPRPRAILALGAEDIAPLPAPDVAEALSQGGLVASLALLRRAFAAGAFAPEVTDFDATVLAARIEYTCPMHPEVISDKPGKCPICGMFLVEHKVSGGTAANREGYKKSAAHPTQAEHADHSAHTGHSEPANIYTCPMHPEVTADAPGSCPKCGMDLVPRGEAQGSGHTDHGGHVGHGGHGTHNGLSGQGGHEGHGVAPDIVGIEPHFMSMVGLTAGKPASPDGLIMEWIEIPFGPFFPGLPGGLMLKCTFDGDSVAEARLRGLGGEPLPTGTALADLPDRLAAAFPLAPVAMRALAVRAVAAAAQASSEAASACAAGLERERIVSHLNWLAGFARQAGLAWLERRAAALHQKLRAGTVGEISAADPAVRKLLRQVRGTPLLRLKLAGIGRLDGAPGGPVARAAGKFVDARTDDAAYAGLGFTPVVGEGGDALVRLIQRCAEIEQSLDLIARAGAIAPPALPEVLPQEGHGLATVETPRGPATLHLTVKGGAVDTAHLTTPFAGLAALVPGMVAQMELADALTAIGSLDLDPWGAGA